MGNVIGFFVGIVLGGTVGAILMGLMCVAGDYDRMEEEGMKKHDKSE